MLLRGTAVIKKSRLIVATLILLSTIIGCNKSNYLDSSLYCEKILALSETSEEIAITEVFDFDFDKAYIVYEIYGDEEYFTETLEVGTKTDIPTLESGGHNRILFIKDNMIIYDFIYDMTEIVIVKTGIWIYPYSTAIFSHKNSNNGDTSIVQIEFLDAE